MALSKNVKCILIFVLPAISYLWLTIHFDVFDNYYRNIFIGDQFSYFETSQSLYGHFQAHHYRSIGYPILLGLPELFGFEAPYGYWPIFLNYIFFSLMLVLFIKIGKILKLNIALPVAVCLALSFGFMRVVNHALTEICFTAIITWALYNLIKLLKNNNGLQDLFYFVLSLGVATLFRPGFYIYTLFIIVLYFIFFIYKSYGAIKTSEIYKRIAIVLVTLLITFGPQSFMMKRTFNTFRLSYIDDITWYRYLGALTYTIDKNNCFTDKCFREEQHKRDVFLRDKTPDQMSGISRADRTDALLNKPKALFKAYKINVASNTHSGAFDSRRINFLNIFTLYTNVILSTLPFLLYGFIFIISRFRNRLSLENHFQILFVLGIISYSILTGAFSAYQGDRFHIVFYPLSLITIVYLFSQLKSENVK